VERGEAAIEPARERLESVLHSLEKKALQIRQRPY
jgi:hypothetical protein